MTSQGRGAITLPKTIDSSAMNREFRTGPHRPHKELRALEITPFSKSLLLLVHPVRINLLSGRRSSNAPGAYMANFPPAVSGQHGHNRTFRAACILVLDFALDRSSALTLLKEWNDRCTPPWNERDLERKISEAEKAQRTRSTANRWRAAPLALRLCVRQKQPLPPLEMVKYFGEQSSMDDEAEARRIAAELVKLHGDGAIGGAEEP